MDLLLCQDRANAGSAQGLQFSFTLDGVGGWEIRINVAWMATQFGNILLNVGLQDVQQAAHADLLQVGLSTPLPIELRHVTDGAVLPQGDSVLPSHAKEIGKQPRVAVDVVVRVEMRRRADHQFLKAAALAV
jgi:hypothetical protein